jgi:hypothetical protein
MRPVLAAVLCIVLATAMFASEKDNGYKVTYHRGSLPDSKAGIGMKTYIESKHRAIGQRQRGCSKDTRVGHHRDRLWPGCSLGESAQRLRLGSSLWAWAR